MNVILWGFEKFVVRDAFLEAQAAGNIKIKAWFGVPEEYEGVTHDRTNFILTEDFQSIPYGECPVELSEIVRGKISEFVEINSRAFLFQQKSVYEHMHAFHLYLHRLYFLLKTQSIQTVFFEDIPHDAIGIIVYWLAKEMKINTVMLVPTFFPNRFFYLFDIDDHGEFSKIPFYPVANKSEMFFLQKQFEKDLFYTKQQPCVKRKEGWLDRKKRLLKKSLLKYDGTNIQKAMQKFLFLQGEVIEEKIFQRNREAFFCEDFQCNEKYIYFPLHLQPEMTTSVLGGIYSDQLLALEALSKKLPNGWKICVKENPKQNHRMRSKYFYMRLRAIPNVVGVKSNTDTYDLIRSCKCVATITGTAGWEAISGGKNVIYFGKPWYANFPGTCLFSEDLDLEDFASCSFDHNEVENAVRLLLKKAGFGLVSQDYLPSIAEYDHEKNTELLLKFISWVTHFLTVEVKT